MQRITTSASCSPSHFHFRLPEVSGPDNAPLKSTRYQLQDLSSAIKSFHRSLTLTPATTPDAPASDELTPGQLVLADTHTNLGAAYILSSPPRPDLALEHLQKALEINPDDAELVYNLAAVLEATEDEEEALVAYQRAESLGIERAAVNIRNVSSVWGLASDLSRRGGRSLTRLRFGRLGRRYSASG